MKILILDDDDRRHLRFAQLFREHHVTHARTFAEFERAIAGSRHDVVYLDHDLHLAHASPTIGNGKRCRACPLTGEDAAILLSDLPAARRPLLVVIHSMNDVGADRIRKILQKSGIAFERKPYRDTFPPP